MRRHRLLVLAAPVLLLTSLFAGPPVAATGPADLPQGTQLDSAYEVSGNNRVSNVFATAQRISCYRPEVPYFGSLAPLDGYSGMSPCNGAPTGEDIGATPYPSQLGSNPGSPATGPMLVKNHSESDIRVDPTNAMHLIGSSKWAVSAEGYNHLLGFYESFDGGVTWPVQGHIPGYEGWTDNTDPVGAFDSFGNYYSLVLPYQFFYNSDGSHNFSINPNQEPNPSLPAEVIAVAIRPHRATGPTGPNDWTTNRQGAMDIVASYPAKGREPDKQWITIDINPASHHFNRIYAMWTIFDGITAHPLVSFADARSDATHTPWSTPKSLPSAGNNPQGVTYLLPNVDGNGTVYTTLTNFEPKSTLTSILLDRSTDGGVTWESVSTVVADVTGPPALYPNTNFRDGIENTFAVGPKLANGRYPLYVAWEDYSTGFGNVKLSASYDGGVTWSMPIRVNDNSTNVDAFQPNLTVAANGTVVVAFYDRRLPCPALGTTEATNAGLALDTVNSRYSGGNPPYGAANYCVNSTVQFYGATLAFKGNNIRTSLHTWDPQLNAMKPSSINRTRGFIGDYYGVITSGSTVYTTSVSTYNDNNTNPNHYQQQVVASLKVP